LTLMLLSWSGVASDALAQSVVVSDQAVGRRNALIRSASDARQLVVQSAEAMGGLDALRSLRALSVERPFRRTTTGQGIRPGTPSVSNGVDLVDADLTRGRFRSLRDMEIDGGQMWSAATVVTVEGGSALNYANHTVSTGSPLAYLGPRAEIQRREVPTLILSALRRSASLRVLPDPARGERAVTFADDDGTQVTLVFDAATHLVKRSETVNDDPAWGDVVTITRFGDYQLLGEGPLHIAATVHQEGPGPERFDMTLRRATVNGTPDSAFAVPSGFRPVGPPPPFVLAPGIIKLGPGVAIEFADYVLVFEGYGDARWSNSGLARIRAQFPGKPIRQLVVSHYHNDHVGGIRNYVAAGASIITVPDAVEAVRNVLSRPHLVTPDSLSVHPRTPAIEIVVEKRILEDSTRRVELYQVGPTAHVDQILIAYLPKERMVIEGDLLDMPGGHPSVGGEDTVEFADLLRRLGLTPERIVPIHGDPGTLEDLAAAIRMHEARRACAKEPLARLSCPYQAAGGR